MHDVLLVIAGGVGFGIITYRSIRMAIRVRKEIKRKRLLNHLNWSVDEYGRPRRA